RNQQHEPGDDHHRPERAFIAAVEIHIAVESFTRGKQPEGLVQVALDHRGTEISELADGRIPYLPLHLTQGGRRRVERLIRTQARDDSEKACADGVEIAVA